MLNCTECNCYWKLCVCVWGGGHYLTWTLRGGSLVIFRPKEGGALVNFVFNNISPPPFLNNDRSLSERAHKLRFLRSRGQKCDFLRTFLWSITFEIPGHWRPLRGHEPGSVPTIWKKLSAGSRAVSERKESSQAERYHHHWWFIPRLKTYHLCTQMNKILPWIASVIHRSS